MIIYNKRLITAEIIYGMPDYPDIMQIYIQQMDDIIPHYPNLLKFLQFWQREIEAKIHFVHVFTEDNHKMRKIKIVDGIWNL